VQYRTTGAGQRVGTLWSNDVRADPLSSPQADRTYQITKLTDAATQFARDLIPSFDGRRDADIPFDKAMTMLPNKLTDSSLQAQAMAVKAWSTSGGNRSAMQDVSNLRQSHFRTRSNTDVPLSDKNAVLNKINDEMHMRLEQVAQSYGMFEKRMKKHFGPDWTLEHFIDAASKNIYNQD